MVMQKQQSAKKASNLVLKTVLVLLATAILAWKRIARNKEAAYLKSSVQSQIYSSRKRPPALFWISILLRFQIKATSKYHSTKITISGIAKLDPHYP